jgi:hypothetical protein
VARQGATELSSTLEIFAASHSGLDSSATFALAGMAHAMAAVDLDAALPVDLVVAEPHEQTSALELFTFAASSTGLQTRLAPMTVAVAGQSTALAAGAINASDANGDVAIAAGESVLLYPGSDAGLGAVAATLAVTGSPTAIAIGDVNGDGAAEVVVVTATVTAAAATAGSGELVVFQASGDGFSFSRLPALALTGTPTAVAIGDVTGDGLPDVAVLTKGNSTGTGRLEVFVQAADGSLHAAEPQPVADDPVAVVIADFNADTRPDIAVVSYGQPVMVFYGQ